MPYKKTIVLLIIGLFALAFCPMADAQWQNIHFPDPGSTKAWGEGDYETRGQIENQWEYERRVIELENDRKRQQWQDQLDENEEMALDNLGIEKTW